MNKRLLLIILMFLGLVSCGSSIKSGNYFLNQYPAVDENAKKIIGSYVVFPKKSASFNSDVEILQDEGDIYNDNIISEDINKNASFDELKKLKFKLNPKNNQVTKTLINANIGLSFEDIEYLEFKVIYLQQKLKVKDLNSFDKKKLCGKKMGEYHDDVYSGKPRIDTSIVTEISKVVGEFVYKFKNETVINASAVMRNSLVEIQSISEINKEGKQTVTVPGVWSIVTVMETKDICNKLAGDPVNPSSLNQDKSDSYDTDPYW